MQLTEGWIGSLRTANRDGVSLAHYTIAIFCFGPSEADRAHVGLAASIRAACPMNFQFLGKI